MSLTAVFSISKKASFACLAFTTAVVLSTSAQAKITVNGETIPQSYFDAMEEAYKAQGKHPTAEIKEMIKQELIRRTVLEQEAKRLKLHEKKDIKAQIALAEQGVLIGAVLTQGVRNKNIDDKKIKQEYDKIVKRLGDKEYKSRHILVKTEKEAKQIIKDLDKGQKFEKLVEQSTDIGSQKNGGDLGWSSKDAFVAGFSDALAKLKKGKYSKTPVKTEFGYHVIFLDDIRDAKHPTFDQAKQEIKNRLEQQTAGSYIEDLMKKSKIIDK